MNKMVAIVLQPFVVGVLLALVIFAFTDGPYAAQDGHTRPIGPDTFSAKWEGSFEGQSSLCDNFVKTRESSYRSGVTYSAKTGYLFKEQIENESILNECNVRQVYGVYRHGTRNPTKKHILEYDKLEIALKEFISHTTSLTEAAKKIRKWTNPFPANMAAELSDAGMKEHYCLSKRLKQRFPGLFYQPYSPLMYSFRSTEKDRTIQSALSFSYGLFEGMGPLNGYQPTVLNIDNKSNDTLLRFFDFCPSYDEKVKENKTIIGSVNSFLDQPVVQQVRDNIQRKIDPGASHWYINTKQLATMYSVCSVEVAILGYSVWCSLFDVSDSAVMEYYGDLKSYLVKGYANPLNWQVSCPLFTDILKQLNGTVHNEPDTATVLLRFGHAETLVPMVAALGLFKDATPLLPTNYNAQESRLFRVANFSPFGGNLAVVLYSCSRDHQLKPLYKVRILIDEKPMSIQHPLCEDEEPFFCPFDKFQQILQDISSVKMFPCDFNQFCSIKL